MRVSNLTLIATNDLLIKEILEHTVHAQFNTGLPPHTHTPPPLPPPPPKHTQTYTNKRVTGG